MRRKLIALVVFVLFVLAITSVWTANAAACLPDPLYPTPTIMVDHDRYGVEIYRVYAQRPGDTVWPWVYDIPFFHEAGVGSQADSSEPWRQDWPIQRVVPTAVQNEEVRIMVKAVGPGNVESAPSEIITVCMSPVMVLH
jgi:hypothetical protein